MANQFSIKLFDPLHEREPISYTARVTRDKINQGPRIKLNNQSQLFFKKKKNQ